MSALPRSQALIPFRRLFHSRGDDAQERYKYFKIVDYKYGTKGYTYTLHAYDSSVGEWKKWGQKYNHMDLFRYFRLPTKAEEVLFGPF